MLILGGIINWGALWKIVLVALAGGCGIVTIYGGLLLGLRLSGAGDSTRTAGEGSKLAGYAIATVCAVVVVGVIVLGIYAMTQKPS